MNQPRPIPAFARFALILVAWTAFGLLTAAQTRLLQAVRGQALPAWSVLGPSVIGAWIWALYTPGLVILARQLRRLRERNGSHLHAWTLFLGAHFVVAAIGCVADAFVWAQVRPLIDGATPAISRVFAGTLLVNVASYLAVVTLTEAHDFAARWREREREAASLARTAETLQGQLDEARLRALEAQLQPHFLYNTLNLVAELVHDDPDAADEMLTRLGMLLRRSYHETAHAVPLREEIRFARGYAEILALRYRDRVTLTFDVPSALEGYSVPAFLLQPLMENAFRHGVERREHHSVVDVIATQRDGAFIIRVRDRGVDNARRGLPVERTLAMSAVRGDSCDDGDGIGLRNTRERLEVLYGASARLTLTRTTDETVAVVSLPIDATRAGHELEVDNDRPEARPIALVVVR
jgi:hypothetical protein